jgi:DNA processing protein
MALLTDATVIVEAGEKSGTLHQGWEALRLGRLLFLKKKCGQ